MAKHIVIGSGRFKFDLSLITVEPVLFLYMFTNFLYYPVFQSLIFDKVCLNSLKFSKGFCDALKSNTSFKDNHNDEYHRVNTETSHWTLGVTVALTIPSFIIVVLFLGALGDRVNRKIPVIMPCIGVLCAYISGILNAHYMTASIYYILIGPILNGLCGGFIACLMAVYGYVGFITSPGSKMMRVGILESMIFLAGTIGVFVSGVIVERKGYIFTFATISVIIFVAILYSIFWLDSLLPVGDREEQQQEGRCNWICAFFKESLQCVTKRRSRRIVLALILQVVTIDVLMLVTSGEMDISFLYLREALDFSSSTYGYFKGLDNFLRGIVLLTFLPFMKKYFKVKNLPLVLVGLISYAANCIVLGVSTHQWMPFLASVFGMFKGIPSAGLRATMSSMVCGDEQGRLFGIIAASESIISLFASLIFNELYPATYKLYHGLCFLLAAFLILVVFGVVLYVILKLADEQDGPQAYETMDDDKDTIQVSYEEGIGVIQPPEGI